MMSCSRVKKIRAILSSRRTRTSHRSASIFRTTDMPSGQPNCTVLISSPMALRCARGHALSHCRTGSRPASVWKKATRKRGIFSMLECTKIGTRHQEQGFRLVGLTTRNSLTSSILYGGSRKWITAWQLGQTGQRSFIGSTSYSVPISESCRR